MAEKGVVHRGEVVEAGRLRLLPTPRRRLPLASVEDVARETARLYRAMKAGDLDVQDGSKMAYVLVGLGKLLELGILEKRLRALEKTIEPGER